LKIRFTSLAVAALLAFSISAKAQQCSHGIFQLFQDDKSTSGPCNVTLLGDSITTKETQGYNLSCVTTSGNSKPGTVYFTNSVTLAGNGERFCGSMLSDPISCDAIFSMTATQATSASDFNRFMFNELDRTVGGHSCNNGATQSIFRQCPGQPCDGTTGGGGGGGSGGTACGNGAGNTGGPTALGDGSGTDDGTTCGPGAGSPIIVDTEGEGFHLTSAAEGVKFDIAGNGHPVQIAWTAIGFRNAFLALPGADGLIHNGKELFGNFTAQDPSKHRNGFLALAEFDEADQGGNGDGVIDEHDAIFSKLRLWIDENHDGICQPDELHTLSELGVFAVALNYQTSFKRDQYGNQFRYKARVNPGARRDKRDEASDVGRWTYDVFFVIGK